MPIRVLLDASTTMARSALRATLGECDDIELIEINRLEPLPADVDVVVLQQQLLRDSAAPLRVIAKAVARIGVVAINDDGQAGDVYRIHHRAWHFAADGGCGLADAIRAVASAS